MEQTVIEVVLALYGVAALIVIRRNSATPRLQETTVAASRTPLLRASVNAMRGRALHGVAVKVGNRHTPKKLRLPGRKAGGGPSMAGKPLTGQVAHHDSQGIRP